MIFDEFEMEKSVKMAADVLDEMYPKWEQAIDFRSLRMEDATSCILGQLGRSITRKEGDYLAQDKDYDDLFSEVADHVKDDPQIMVAFDLDNSEEAWVAANYHGGWRMLGEVWKKAVRERR